MFFYTSHNNICICFHRLYLKEDRLSQATKPDKNYWYIQDQVRNLKLTPCWTLTFFNRFCTSLRFLSLSVYFSLIIATKIGPDFSRSARRVYRSA